VPCWLQIRSYFCSYQRLINKRQSHFSFKVAASTGKICTPQLLMALALL
jgi:hypothetical protein